MKAESPYWREAFVTDGVAESAVAALDVYGDGTAPRAARGRADDAHEVIEQLVEELIPQQRTVRAMADLHTAASRLHERADEQARERSQRSERAQLWRETLPDLAAELLG